MTKKAKTPKSLAGKLAYKPRRPEDECDLEGVLERERKQEERVMAKKGKMDLDTLIASIENWDGKNPPLHEVISSSLAQGRLVRNDASFVRDLAEALRVSSPTIVRWAHQQTEPHPLLLQWIGATVRRTLIALREEASSNKTT